MDAELRVWADQSRRRGLDEHEAPPPPGETARCVGRLRSSRFRRRLANMLPSCLGSAPRSGLLPFSGALGLLAIPRYVNGKVGNQGINHNRRHMAAPIGLQPTAALAERVLLPGDPGRALHLAESLLDGVKMFNHHRGLWGYTGLAPDGAPLTIQSTGMGGPSAAIVISELVDLGARRLLRIGTCGGLQEGLGLGDLVVATESIAADGTSRALGAGERVPAGPDLLAAVRAAAVEDQAHAVHRGPVVSTDVFYDRRGLEHEWSAAGAVAVEMEAATLFALASIREVEAAALLVVSDLVLPARIRISQEDLRVAEQRMGEAALRALSLEPGPQV
jgi:DeoD family purine-nucleoside phosphorylase